MWVRPNVVVEPYRQLIDEGAGIGFVNDEDVVALQRSHEGLRRSVALRALDRCRSRYEADVAREAACLVSGVAAEGPRLTRHVAKADAFDYTYASTKFADTRPAAISALLSSKDRWD